VFAITDWEISSEHYHYSRRTTYAQHNDRKVLVNLTKKWSRSKYADLCEKVFYPPNRIAFLRSVNERTSSTCM